MNRLPVESRCLLLQMLVEGMSMRAASRTVGCSVNTTMKLVVEAGAVCSAYLDEVMVDLPCKEIQLDELWSFVHAKDKRIEQGRVKNTSGAGSIWTWTAICTDTRLIPCWQVGDRTLSTATVFCHDLARRLSGRVQLTTDGHSPYREAIFSAFSVDVDFGQVVKEYKANRFAGSEKLVVTGRPRLERIGTSYIERSNLTVRMGNRRYARRTNAHSKKIANHVAMLGLFFGFYNLVRRHRSIKTTPAVAAGVMAREWTIHDLVRFVEEELPAPAKPGPKPGKKRCMEQGA